MKQRKTKKKIKPSATGKKGKKITLSGIIGIVMGALLFGGGLYRAIAHGEDGGYFVAVIGFCFLCLLAVIGVRSDKR